MPDVIDFTELFDVHRPDLPFREVERKLAVQVLNSDTFEEARTKYIEGLPFIAPWRFVFATDSGSSIGQLVNRKFSRTAVAISLWGNSSLGFLDQQTVIDEQAKGKAEIPLDYSISIDTQTISYVHSAIQGNASKLPEDFPEVLDFISQDHVYVDPVPYMIENLGSEDMTQLQKIKDTIASYEHLRSVDLGLFKRCGVLQSRHSPNKFKEVVKQLEQTFLEDPRMRISIDAAKHKQSILKVVLMQTILIQWKFSKKSLKNKLYALLTFMNEKMGAIFQREIVLASSYFQDSSQLLFFKRIMRNRLHEDLMLEINGMAWDLHHMRKMETTDFSDSEGGARHFIPAMLTFDAGLAQLLQKFPLRVLAVRQGKSLDWLSVPATPRFGFGTEEFEADFVQTFYTKEAIRQRAERSDALTDLKLNELTQTLRDELASMCVAP